MRQSQMSRALWTGNNTKAPMLEPVINSSFSPTDMVASSPSTKKSHYKRFQIPPDLEICQQHRAANAFGLNNQSSGQRCPCCNELMKSQLKFSCSSSDIYRVNEPVGYYFTFLKMMMLCLLFMVIFPGIYSIVKIDQDCDQASNNCNYIYGIPFPKLKAFYTEVTLALNAAILVVLYVVIAFLFYWNVFVHQKMRLCHRKAADEHVFISGIDHSKVQQHHLIHHLKDYNVQQVIYTYRIKEYLQLLCKKNQIEALRRKYERQNKPKKVNRLNGKLKKIDTLLIPIKNQFQIGNDLFMRTDKAFLKFSHSQDKLRFERAHKKGLYHMAMGVICNISNLNINDCNLFVERLGDPREIIWQNLQVSSARRYISIFINNIATLLILALSLYIMVELTYSQKQYEESSDVLLAVTFSIVIEIVNMFLGMIINFCTRYEGRYTITGQSSTKLIKKCLAYFLNTTLIPFSLFLFNLFRPEEDNLLQNIFTLFVMCNILSPFLGQYVPFSAVAKWYKQRRIKKLGFKCLQTQIHANQVFEKMDFDLEERYGLLCQRLMNCMFYAAIFPVGAIITLVGILITFIIAKYQLVKVCSIPKHSFRLGILINQIACFFPCIYSFGYVANLYIYQQNPTYDVLYSIILAAFTLPISVLFLIFGHQIAKRYVNPNEIENSNLRVDEEVSYKDLNPTSFLMGENKSDSGISSRNIFHNLARYSIFRQGVNFSRLSRNTLSSGLKTLEDEDISSH